MHNNRKAQALNSERLEMAAPHPASGGFPALPAPKKFPLIRPQWEEEAGEGDMGEERLFEIGRSASVRGYACCLDFFLRRTASTSLTTLNTVNAPTTTSRA